MTDRKEYLLKDFYFDLPEDLIAQYPGFHRDASRLLVVDTGSNTFSHRYFSELPSFLQDGDVLVMNNVRVIPARIYAKRATGGEVEIILTRKIDSTHWEIVCNRTKRIREDEILYARNNADVQFTVVKKSNDVICIESNTALTEEVLLDIGTIPLPPYIQRKAEDADYQRYQTVYASEAGAAASPTAGLHFTDRLMEDVMNRGVQIVFLTLYVSWGTFQPVRQDDISRHQMHSESFVMPEETASAVNLARSEGRRVIAVGTTSLRVLEATYREGKNHYGKGETDIFIYPPYNVRSADALVTNFHTPGSTLLMLVTAFGGYDTIMSAYKVAVNEGYRFFSYGDAMMILSKEARYES